MAHLLRQLKQKAIRITLLTAGALLFVASSAEAQQVIEIPAEPYALTEALDVAAEGDVLLLTTDGGVYEDTTLYITKDITIRAAEGLDERPVLAYRWDDWDGTATRNIIVTEGDLTLDGVNVGREEADSVGIAIFYAAEEPSVVRILNSEFRNNGSSVLRNEKDAYVATIDSLIVRGSYFHDIGNNVFGIQGNSGQLGLNYATFQNSTFGSLNADRAVAAKLDLGSGSDSAEVFVDHVTIDQAKIGFLIKGDVSVNNSEIKNTIVSNTTSPAIRWVGSPMEIHHLLMWNVDRTLAGDAYAGEVILEEDPMFVDPDAGNYALQDGSPAAGAADDGKRLGDPRGWTLGIATSAEELEIVPETMALGQNHPNPFNTRTTVSYTLKRTTEVRLDVYNMIGQKVLNVEHGVRAAGDHHTTIEAGGLPAGVYVYRLRAGAQDQTRTMTVVR